MPPTLPMLATLPTQLTQLTLRTHTPRAISTLNENTEAIERNIAETLRGGLQTGSSIRARSGTLGSGTPGSGTPGSGTPGSGTQGLDAVAGVAVGHEGVSEEEQNNPLALDLEVGEDGQTALPSVTTTTLLSGTKEGLEAYDKNDDGVVDYKDFRPQQDDGGVGTAAAADAAEAETEAEAEEGEGTEETKDGDVGITPATSNSSDSRSNPFAAIGGGIVAIGATGMGGLAKAAGGIKTGVTTVGGVTVGTAVAGVMAGVDGVKSATAFVEDGFATIGEGFGELVVGIGEGRSSTGIVTFKTLAAASSAQQLLLTNLSFSLSPVSQAPDPRDIIWKNISMPHAAKVSKEETFGYLAILGALFGWLPLITWCQLLGNLDRYKLGRWASSDWAITIQSQLPAIIQVIVVSLLPMVLEYLAINFEQRKTHSDVQKATLSRHFYYQMVNVLATIGLSSLFSNWQRLQQVVYEPECLLLILGRSVPGVAGYFMQMIIIKACVGLPMMLAQVVPFLSATYWELVQNQPQRARWFTQRQLDAKTTNVESSQCKPGTIYPDMLLVLIIMNTYAVIAPLVLLTGVLFFGLSSIVLRWNCLFVYVPKLESGGSYFPMLFDYSMVALLTAQIVLIAFFLLTEKENFTCAYSLFPLPLLTWYYYRRVNAAYRERSIVVLAQDRAVRIDRNNERLKGDIWAGFDPECFRQPCLSESAVEPMAYRREVGGDGGAADVEARGKN